MVGPGEGALAQVTLKGSVPGVLAEVAGELVGTGELPTATLPAAMIGLLACVRSVMRLQVGTLRVRLAASRISARVRSRPLPRPRASPPLRFGVHLQRG